MTASPMGIAPPYCYACGTARRGDARFCTRCGTTLLGPAGPGPMSSVPTQVPRARAPLAPTQVPSARAPLAPNPVPTMRAPVAHSGIPLPTAWSPRPFEPDAAVRPRSPWYARPATAIVAASVAVVAVGAAVAVVLHGGPAGSTPAPVAVQDAASPAGASSSGPTSVAPTEAPGQLQALAGSDSATVEGLVGSWVPQLSSKRPGLVADGQTWDAASILAEDQALRAAHPDVRLLWSGDFANYRGHDFWVSVVGDPMPTAAAANTWCDAQGFDADHCYAVRLTHSGGPAGNSVMRR